jgi:hypothetical protein
MSASWFQYRRIRRRVQWQSAAIIFALGVEGTANLGDTESLSS